MSDRKNYYIHTINGRPAFFDGNQICYASKHQREGNVACTSLAQLRRQQHRSAKWRYEMFGETGMKQEYGYVRFTLPQEQTNE